MRSVYQNLHSYFGIFCGDRRPKRREKGKQYGFPLLRRSSKRRAAPRKPMEEPIPNVAVIGKRLVCVTSSNPIHSIGAGVRSDAEDSPFFATEGTATVFPSSCSTRTSAQAFDSVEEVSSIFIDDGIGEIPSSDCIVEKWSPDKSNGGVVSRDCLNTGHKDSITRSRLHSAAVHSFRYSLDASFDKSAIQYYACGKKPIHNGRLGSQLLRCEQSSSGCVTATDNENEISLISEISDVEDPRLSSQEISPCVSPPNVQPKLETSPSAEGDSVGEGNCLQVRKSEDFSSAPELSFNVRNSTGEGCCADISLSACEAGFSEHQMEEEESHWETACAPSLSKDRRRTFPPPLNSMAMQSYSDSRGRCTGFCRAGYSLRSLRKDGRFMLQEVKAPTHKFFLVSREDGRLKLDLIDPVNDSSEEDYSNRNYEDLEDIEDVSAEDIRLRNPSIEEKTCLQASNENLQRKDMVFAEENSPLLGTPPSSAGNTEIRASCLHIINREDMSTVEGPSVQPSSIARCSENRASCTIRAQEDFCKDEMVLVEESAPLFESPSLAGWSEDKRSSAKSSWVHPMDWVSAF